MSSSTPLRAEIGTDDIFVVSQLTSAALFDERPSPSLLLGGALIVAGGLVIQLGQ